MYNQEDNLIINRGIDPLIISQREIEADIINCVDEVNEFVGILPNDPPFEKHPYLDLNEYELQNFDKYIIGTCPPISYLNDILDVPQLLYPNGKIIKRPQVAFFHGNDLKLWKMLFNAEELLEFDNLNRNRKKIYLINKLIELKINYSDTIKYFQRKQYSVEDKDIKNITPNLKLIKQILENPTAEFLNFNTSSVFNSEGLKVYRRGIEQGKVNVNKINSYNLFLRLMQDLGFDLEVDLQDGIGWVLVDFINSDYLEKNYKNKIFSKIRISAKNDIAILNKKFSNINRVFTIITGPSPSGLANVRLGANEVFLNWNIQNNMDINEFRKQIYFHFKNNEWEQLLAMNL